MEIFLYIIIGGTFVCLLFVLIDSIIHRLSLDNPIRIWWDNNVSKEVEDDDDYDIY
jgi:hypothetical protein